MIVPNIELCFLAATLNDLNVSANMNHHKGE